MIDYLTNMTNDHINHLVIGKRVGLHCKYSKNTIPQEKRTL